MKLVTVSRAFSPCHAQLVRSRLEAAGFFPLLASMEGAAE
jgi:hypothetical protein